MTLYIVSSVGTGGEGAKGAFAPPPPIIARQSRAPQYNSLCIILYHG